MQKKEITKAEFMRWFKARFWEISGKIALPTADELDELASDCWNKSSLANK